MFPSSPPQTYNYDAHIFNFIVNLCCRYNQENKSKISIPNIEDFARKHSSQYCSTNQHHILSEFISKVVSPTLNKRRRNLIAARKVRNNQKQRINNLENEKEKLLADNRNIENEIALLRNQVTQLQSTLTSHDCAYHPLFWSSKPGH